MITGPKPFDNAYLLWNNDFAQYKQSRPEAFDCSLIELDNWKGAQICAMSWECRGERVCGSKGYCEGKDACDETK